MRVRNQVILEVTNDEFSLPVRVYLSTREMANDLKITINNAQSKITRASKSKYGTHYIRVRFTEET